MTGSGTDRARDPREAGAQDQARCRRGRRGRTSARWR